LYILYTTALTDSFVFFAAAFRATPGSRIPYREIWIEFWWGNLKERGVLEDLVVDRTILKGIVKEEDAKTSTVFIRLRI
jgi:hypothetical protein